MSSNAMIHSIQELEEVRTTILSVLVSHKNGCTLSEFNKSYYDFEGRPVPWKRFGHSSLIDLLSSMPDIVNVESNSNEIILRGIPSTKTKHITKMVANQKDQETPARKTFRPSRYFPTTYPSMAFIPAAVLAKLIIFVEQHPKGVKMNCILRAISSHISYIRITTDHIYTQIQWLSHRIYSDLDKVYPKNPQSEEHSSNCAKYAGYSLNEMFNDNVKVNTKILISDHIKSQLEKLISKCSNGITCEDLPNAYLNEYGVHLYYNEIGFNSVLEYVSVLTDIFHLVQCQKTGIFKVYYTKRDISLETAIPLLEIKGVEQSSTDNVATAEKIPTEMKRILLTPNDVMAIGDYVEPIKVADIECNELNLVEVRVSEVYTPTVFWVMLRSNTRRFHRFITQFNIFYAEKHAEYKIPPNMIERGLYCACKYNMLWQRAIIKQVQENRVTVVFLDYGTLKSYPPESLYYLRKEYSQLPSQAILCSAFNIKPSNGSHWSDSAREKFARLTKHRDLVALIMSRNETENSMSITLTDTSKDNYDIHIMDLLVKFELATTGKIICKKNQNFPFQYYLECKRREETSVKKVNSVVTNGDVKNKEEAREENSEGKEKESLASEEEENKENDLNYKFAMDLYEWGTSENSTSSTVNSQNKDSKNLVYKTVNRYPTTDFFKAIKNSSDYVLCDPFIPWSPSGNITEQFKDDNLNLGNIEDHNKNNANVITKTENRRENGVSKVLSNDSSPKVNGIHDANTVDGNINEKVCISIKDKTEIQSNESSCEINSIKYSSNEETVRNSIETSEKGTPIDANTFNPMQRLLFLKRLLSLRQMKSDSDDTSSSNSESSHHNCNSELQMILQQLSKDSEPVKADVESDNTVLGQKKGSDYTDQAWVSDHSVASTSLNNTDSSSDLVKTEIKSVSIKNVEKATKDDSNYLRRPLLIEEFKSNSSSEVETPVEILHGDSSSLVVTSSDSNSNSDVINTRSVSMESNEMKMKSDSDSLEKLWSNESSNSEVEGPVEMLDENSLININPKIPTFNDMDLDSMESCSDFDMQNPLSFFKGFVTNNIDYNEGQNTEKEEIKITEINDSDSNDQEHSKQDSPTLEKLLQI